MTNKARLNLLASVLLPLCVAVLLFILWQTEVLHILLGTDTITLPLPTRIGEIIGQNADAIWEHTQISLRVALGGLVMGSVLGYGIALIATIFPKWGAGGLSIVSAFNAIPIVALAPVINNWTRDISTEVDQRSTVAKMLVVMIFLICLVLKD